MVMRSFRDESIKQMREKRLPKRGAATIRNVVDKAEEVADQARRAGEENNLNASEALRQFNLKFLQLARENSEATFEFLTDIVNAKDIQAAAIIVDEARAATTGVMESAGAGNHKPRPNDCQPKHGFGFAERSVRR
jgi:thioredoxin-like negative regulator of GroEL